MGGRGKKLVLAIDGNTSNFEIHLRRHHLKWYAELIEVQEKGYLNIAIVIYTVILYKVLYHLKNLYIIQL